MSSYVFHVLRYPVSRSKYPYYQDENYRAVACKAYYCTYIFWHFEHLTCWEAFQWCPLQLHDLSYQPENSAGMIRQGFLIAPGACEAPVAVLGMFHLLCDFTRAVMNVSIERKVIPLIFICCVFYKGLFPFGYWNEILIVRLWGCCKHACFPS